MMSVDVQRYMANLKEHSLLVAVLIASLFVCASSTSLIMSVSLITFLATMDMTISLIAGGLVFLTLSNMTNNSADDEDDEPCSCEQVKEDFTMPKILEDVKEDVESGLEDVKDGVVSGMDKLVSLFFIKAI